MRTKNFTVRIPNCLKDCLAERTSQLGMDAVSTYILSLIRYDLLIGKPHHYTGDFHRLSNSEQDRIDDEIARAFQSGDTLGGSWFEARIKQATEEAALAKEPEPSRVAEKITAKLKRKKAAKE